MSRHVSRKQPSHVGCCPGVPKTLAFGHFPTFNMRAFALVVLSCALVAVFAAKKDSKDEKKEDYGTVIGIDLGTTYSV